MFVRSLFAIAIAIMVSCPCAWADSVTIDGIGSSSIELSAKSVKNLFTADNGVSGSKLAKLHQKLKGDGIKTNGRVTFVLTTSATHGLSLVTLVDNQKASSSGGSDNSSLFISSSADGDVDLAQTDPDELGSDSTADGASVAGDFLWNSQGQGDAFAWTNLSHQDNGSFSFQVNADDPATFPGLKELKTFQFVTWTGSEWKVVKFGKFNDDGSFSFAFTVAPLPPAFLLGAAGLLGVMALRRHATRRVVSA